MLCRNSDVIVGAPHYDTGEHDEGHTFVCYGSASGLAQPEDSSFRVQFNEIGKPGLEQLISTSYSPVKWIDTSQRFLIFRSNRREKG